MNGWRHNSLEACDFATLRWNESGELEWWWLCPEGLVSLLQPSHLSGFAGWVVGGGGRLVGIGLSG